MPLRAWFGCSSWVWATCFCGREANLALDERDLAIKYRSRDYAYGVLMVGMIIVGCVMPFRSTGWEIVNTAIFMILLAEVVQDAAMIYSYRKQLG